MADNERAERLHRQALVIDGHSDILLPVVNGITTLDQPFGAEQLERWQVVAEQTPAPLRMSDVPYDLDPVALHIAPAGQYELPLLEHGGVTAQCVSIFLPENRLNEALETALEMVAALHRAVEANADRCLLATCMEDIRSAKREGKVAYVLTMEGAEPFGARLDLIDIFHRLGLRMTTLTHSRRNLLADGTQLGIETGGLTSLGKRAVERCVELGIVVDTAHLADRGFWDLVELIDGPLLCSHTSVLTPSPGYRAPWDELNATYGMSKAEAIASKGGLIGVVFWSMEDTANLVREINAIIEQVGADHVGLGTDFFGFRDAPRDLRHIGELPALTRALVDAGHDDETILKVLGGNYARVFEQVWGR
ncbi:MAG TPA: membrane dipeptidase [Thermomicrobiales bacterium]|nr:membrane dipeptidase [Thermomicrobiales bacterium]